jgi:putrescine importer
VVACFGSGLTGQAGAARLLYGMGRDDMLPRRLFGRLHPKRGIPTWNLGLIGLLALIAGLAGTYQTAAELLNFGAFLAFLGVNLAAIQEFYVRRRQGRCVWRDLVAPGAGFAFCLAIWISLPWPAKIAGAAWLIAGAAYLAWKTSGFREQLAAMDFKET